MDLTIRKANMFDQTPLLRLLDKWFEESLIKGLPGPCAYSGPWLADLIARHMVFVAVQGDKLLGALGLCLTNLPWNNEVKILTNPFLMTEVEGRSLGVANKLIEAARQFAKELKMILQISHMSGKDAKLKDRYLELKGFEYAGGSLFYLGESNG